MNNPLESLGTRPEFLPPPPLMTRFTQSAEPLRIGIIDYHCDFTRILQSLIPRHHEVITYTNIPLPAPERIEGAVDILINHHEAWYNDKYKVPTIILPYGTVLPSHVKIWNKNPNIIGILDMSGMLASKYPTIQAPLFSFKPTHPFAMTYEQAGNKVITLILDYSKRFMDEYDIASSITEHTIGNTTKDFRQDNLMVRDLDALKEAKWLLHIKYDGYVCNAVMKALACGVPIIMDTKTWKNCCFEAYVIHDHNAIVLPTEELKDFLENCPAEQYERIKKTCVEEAPRYRKSFRWTDGWWRSLE
jgi:hypothetical protein